MTKRTLPRRSARRAAFIALAALLTGALGVVSSRTAANADVPNTCSAVRSTTTVGAWHDSRIDSATDVDWFRFSVTAPRHALVTLGALSSNLSLSVYDSSCHLLTTSNRGGTLFEQLYRSFARGNYFARVSGVSGATGAYALQFRVLGNGLDVLSSRSRVESGRVVVIADLLNNVPTSRDFADVAALFYDGKGRVVNATTCQVDAVVIAPWHRAPLECDAAVPSSYDHYRIVVDQSDQPGYVMHGLTVHRQPGVAQPDGSLLYTGTLANGNSFRVTEVVLAVVVRDDAGRVLSVDSTFLRDIGAHSSRSWQLQTEPVSGAQQVSFYADARRPGY